MEKKEAARRYGNIERARKTSTTGGAEIIARAYRALPAVIGLPFGVMFALGVIFGW